MRVKHSVLSGIALALLLLGQAPGWAMYQINPNRIEISIPKGKSIGSAFVRVTNPDKETLRLKAYLADWELQENGGLVFHEDKPDPNSINPNVRFNPQEFEVLPGKTQIVRIAVKAPEGQSDKEYHSMLFFEDLKTSTQRMNLGKEGLSAALEIKQRLGVAMYIYNGAIKSRPQLVSFTCNTDNNAINTHLELENIGSHHYRGVGSLFITQWDTVTNQYKPFREVPVADQQDIVILPNGKRAIQQILTSGENSDFPAGKYLLELHLAAKNEEGLDTIVASQEVEWAGPVPSVQQPASAPKSDSVTIKKTP